MLFFLVVNRRCFSVWTWTCQLSPVAVVLGVSVQCLIDTRFSVRADVNKMSVWHPRKIENKK